MKKENLAVLIQARANARPYVERKVYVPAHKPNASDDGREQWTRFKSECVLLKRKESKHENFL